MIERFKNKRVAIIDADSIAFIVGWNHKEHSSVEKVQAHVDDFVHSILQATQVRDYIGMLAPKGEVVNFRNTIAVTSPYKGNRGEKPEWYILWAKVIEDRLIEEWSFVRGPLDMETDDIVVSLHQVLANVPFCTPILCGNDKDALQSSGHHYNISKNVGMCLNNLEAKYNLFYQVLMGDKTDNIAGLKGCGKVGAANILTNPELNEGNYALAAIYAYIEKLGEDEGIQRFYENYMLCKMRPVDVTSYIDNNIVQYDLDAGSIREVTNTEISEDDTPSIEFGENNLFEIK